MAYDARISSSYVRRAEGWKLACQQHSPIEKGESTATEAGAQKRVAPSERPTSARELGGGDGNCPFHQVSPANYRKNREGLPPGWRAAANLPICVPESLSDN